MSDDPKIEQALALIAEAISDAYERGRADAIAAMVAAVKGAKQQTPAWTTAPILAFTIPDQAKREKNVDSRTRAPRGSAERVIKRAIETAKGSGVTVPDIMAARNGPLELKLVDSSIRGELRRGAKAGKYMEHDGRWFEAL